MSDQEVRDGVDETRPTSAAEPTSGATPLRRTGAVVGVLLMLGSLIPGAIALYWLVQGVPVSDSHVTTKRELRAVLFPEVLYVVAMVLWLLGLGVFAMGVFRWYRRALWIALVVTAALMVISMVASMIGAFTTVIQDSPLSRG